MVGITVAVVTGLVSGIGLIILFGAYLVPEKVFDPQDVDELYDANLARMSIDANCTTAECAFSAITSCEVPMIIVVEDSEQAYHVWRIDVRENHTDYCRVNFHNVDLRTIKSGFPNMIDYDCRIPNEMLLNTTKSSFRDFISTSDEPYLPRCGLSMP